MLTSICYSEKDVQKRLQITYIYFRPGFIFFIRILNSQPNPGPTFRESESELFQEPDPDPDLCSKTIYDMMMFKNS